MFDAKIMAVILYGVRSIETRRVAAANLQNREKSLILPHLPSKTSFVVKKSTTKKRKGREISKTYLTPPDQHLLEHYSHRDRKTKEK